MLQVGLALKRRRQARERVPSLAPPGVVVPLLRALPFALTSAQERVWSEIRADLARPVPMNRLLQGTSAPAKRSSP